MSGQGEVQRELSEQWLEAWPRLDGFQVRVVPGRPGRESPREEPAPACRTPDRPRARVAGRSGVGSPGCRQRCKGDGRWVPVPRESTSSRTERLPRRPRTRWRGAEERRSGWGPSGARCRGAARAASGSPERIKLARCRNGPGALPGSFFSTAVKSWIAAAGSRDTRLMPCATRTTGSSGDFSRNSRNIASASSWRPRRVRLSPSAARTAGSRRPRATAARRSISASAVE